MRRKEVDDVLVCGKMICPRLKHMHGLKSGSCRFWQRTDLPPGSNMHGLKSGACRFWQRTDLPPVSNMLRAEIQRALRRAPRQLRRLARLANSPGFKSFRCPRWRIKFSLERFSDQSCFCVRAEPLKNSAGRVPQAADGACKRISQTGSCRSPRTV